MHFLGLVLIWMTFMNSHPTPDVAVKSLYEQQNWEAVVELTSDLQFRPVDMYFYRGMAFARLQRWPEAKSTLRDGWKMAAHDGRFPTELAGIAFKEGDLATARMYLRNVLKLDAHNDYANEFLGTVYYLEGNLGACLKYWNRSQKPEIEGIRAQPQPAVDPILLDQAFAVSRSELLRYEDYLATESNLRLLEIFPRFRLELSPRQDGNFDMVLHASERNGFGSNKVDTLVNVFRDLPLQTIHGAFYNIRGSATNSVSLYRWAPEKQMLSTSLSGPFAGKPRRRYVLRLDARDETWDLAQSFQKALLPAPDLRVRKVDVGIELKSASSGRWAWHNGLSFSARRFEGGAVSAPNSASLFVDGLSVQYYAGLEHDLLLLPEHRWSVRSFADLKLEGLFSTKDLFSTLELGLVSRWYPRSRGDDFAMLTQVRTGKTFGKSPLDELFVLGMDGDSDLWLRGHNAIREKKGQNPMGTDYVLMNWEMDKIIHQAALLQLKLSPFVDIGKAFDSSGQFGSGKWLVDAGLQCKIRVAGIAGFGLTYGKNLRTGRNTFYFSVSPRWSL